MNLGCSLLDGCYSTATWKRGKLKETSYYNGTQSIAQRAVLRETIIPVFKKDGRIQARGFYSHETGKRNKSFLFL